MELCKETEVRNPDADAADADLIRGWGPLVAETQTSKHTLLRWIEERGFPPGETQRLPSGFGSIRLWSREAIRAWAEANPRLIIKRGQRGRYA